MRLFEALRSSLKKLSLQAQLALQSERFLEAEQLARQSSKGLRVVAQALLGQGKAPEALAVAREAMSGGGLARATALLSEAEALESSREAQLRLMEARKVFQAKSKRMEAEIDVLDIV